MNIKRAIISVSDKTGIVNFAMGLGKMGIEILSTGGTSKTLRENKIEVKDISEHTGFPEILDGRLKTLHPLVHGGILGIRNDPKHKKEMAENNIQPIDMVVVNLYPFEETVAKKDCALEHAIENIDIGGPTMLRAAAKNYRDVAVLVDPNDYEWILDELKASKGLSEATKFKLAQKVFAHTARYDSAICNYLNAVENGEKKEIFPANIGLTYDKVQDLRYGENPHQRAAFYKEHEVKEPCIANAVQLHGKELSYNNIMDADAAIEITKEFSGEAFTTIVKHTNPCGAAVSKKDLLDSFEKAKASDPTSSFGGIVSLSDKVDERTAKAIADTFFEVIIAPDFSEGALGILTKKKNIRLLKLAFATGKFDRCSADEFALRQVVGGILVQDRDLAVIDVRKCDVVTKRKPTATEYDALNFAWKICKHVKSNAIVFSSEDQILGAGAGQMSRVDSVQIAAGKMQRYFGGAKIFPIVLASDAFFPFRDGVDMVAKAGATAIIQPGGSVKDQESIDAANEHNLAMIFTAIRHFKH